MTYKAPRWLNGKEYICQCRRPRFDPWVGKIPWISKWQPIPVFLPGKSHGQRSLGGYSPRGRERVRHELATNKDNMAYRYSTTQSMNILSGWQIPSNPFPDALLPKPPSTSTIRGDGHGGLAMLIQRTQQGHFLDKKSPPPVSKCFPSLGKMEL